jgi:UrcA family protein
MNTYPVFSTFVATALALLASPAAAQANPFDADVAVQVRLPAIHGPASARRAITMLDRAALVACGGSDDSFAQVKDAVRQSSCWNRAMASAVRQAGAPSLSALWALNSRRNGVTATG